MVAALRSGPAGTGSSRVGRGLGVGRARLHAGAGAGRLVGVEAPEHPDGWRGEVRARWPLVVVGALVAIGAVQLVTGPLAVRVLGAAFVAGGALLAVFCRVVVVADEHGRRAIEPVVITPVDSVGAGDTFCGWLAAEVALAGVKGNRLHGEPIDAAVRAANAAGAWCATRSGARSAPSRAELDSFRRGQT